MGKQVISDVAGSGHIKAIPYEWNEKDVRKLFDVILLGMKAIAEKYPDFVTLEVRNSINH